MAILLTTANFPEIMLFAYLRNRYSVIFFIIYLIFGLFFLLNLVLAVYYNNYRKRVDHTINKFISIRDQFLHNKFKSYDKGQKGYLRKKEFKEMIQDLLLQDLKQIKKKSLNRISRLFSIK